MINVNDLIELGFEEYPISLGKLEIFIKDNKYVVKKKKGKYFYQAGESAFIKVKSKAQLVNLIK